MRSLRTIAAGARVRPSLNEFNRSATQAAMARVTGRHPFDRPAASDSAICWSFSPAQ